MRLPHTQTAEMRTCIHPRGGESASPRGPTLFLEQNSRSGNPVCEERNPTGDRQEAKARCECESEII